MTSNKWRTSMVPPDWRNFPNLVCRFLGSSYLHCRHFFCNTCDALRCSCWSFSCIMLYICFQSAMKLRAFLWQSLNKLRTDFLSWQKPLAEIFDKRNLAPKPWLRVSHDWFPLKKHGCEWFLRWQEIRLKATRWAVTFEYDLLQILTLARTL